MGHRGTRAACCIVVVLAATLAALLPAALGQQTAPSGSSLVPTSVTVDAKGTATVTYTLNITLFVGAPSCYLRPIVLISGVFHPVIKVHQNDIFRVVLINNIPANYPSVAEGISIHWHGLRQPGAAAWHDGVSYVTLCPITPGTSYNFEFKIPDPPGTYFFHDHAGGVKGDGLQGALIVLPPRAPPAPGTAPAPAGTLPSYPMPTVPDLWEYDGEFTVFVVDWYHSTVSSLLMRQNMPFDASKVTPDSGTWAFFGSPQTLLINGKGFYGDCAACPGPLCANPKAPCNVSALTVAPGRSPQQPWASVNNPGCTHEVFKVEPGKRYRVRVISASLFVHMTVCFEGHNVTQIAVDSIPTAPKQISCANVFSGQRMDVMLTTDQQPTNYWITVSAPFRPGTPAGYAVLNYAGANATVPPTTPPPQPADIVGDFSSSDPRLSDELINVKQPVPDNVNMYLEGHPNQAPPLTADKVVVVNISQPMLRQDGVIKYALNNVAHSKNPPCKPFMHLLTATPKWLDKNAVNKSSLGANASMYDNVGISEGKRSAGAKIFELEDVPVYPAVGLHIVRITAGQVIDVVVNNGMSSDSNGDYIPGLNRTLSDNHPFHLHGYRFWVLGRGFDSRFDPAVHSSMLNTVNPPLRDVVVVPAYGWAVLRFRADNPGVWPFHCHILPHMFIGQMLYFVDSEGNIAPPPANRPKCPKECRFNHAPYTKSWLASKWGMSGFELPPL